MRRLMLMGMLALTTASQVEAQRPAAKAGPPKAALRPAPVVLPVFSFLGDDTETPTTRTALNAAACTTSGDKTTCDDYSSPKIGGADLKWLSLSYNRGLMYEVMGGTWTNRYSTLLDAFTAKYGPPKVETRKWQAKSGATFDNTAAIWQFKGGTLELVELGPDLNTALFTFVSTVNAPPKEKPKVDF